jgi:alanine-glyoxylate transaminase/serine-glyoxylate transaminase/serine-pyruvate transaminase
VVRKRNRKVQSWFMDLNLVMGYWSGDGARVYHHTAPINPLYALHESLVMLEEEGLENSWARHSRIHKALVAGAEAMGLSFIVDEAYRLPQLNAIAVPDGVNEAAVRVALLERYNLEIGAGLGDLAGKVWRVGLLGQSASPEHVTLFLAAMEDELSVQGAPINVGAALPAMREALSG